MNESRAQLQSVQESLAVRFWQNEPIDALMLDLSNGIDTIISELLTTT